MKTRIVIATLATVAVAQAGIIVWLLRLAGQADPLYPSSMAPSVTGSMGSSLPSGATNVTLVAKHEPVTNRVDWRAVESADYRQYIANLRAIGCPEETIRDIITADVNKLFEPRFAALRALAPKFQFWQTGFAEFGGLDSANVEARQKLIDEKRALLRELLGVEPPDEPGGMLAAGLGLVDVASQFQRMLEFLPADKRRAVVDIEARYGAKTMELFKDTNGVFDEDHDRTVAALQRAKEEELARLLDPKEFEQYLLHMSDTAQTMRFTLEGFNPTEQEFRDIFAASRPFESATAELNPEADGADTKEQAKQRAAAQEQLDAELKARLGPERFAEYERIQDYDYKNLLNLGKKFDLPQDSAAKVYDMKKAAQNQARVLRNDKSLGKEQRDAALRAIRAETESAVRGVLGDKAYDSYQKRTGGWMHSLSPDPKPKQ